MATLEVLPAQELDLKIYRGDTVEPILFELLQDDEITPINISGWTFAAQIREKQDDTAVVAAFTAVITDAPNGRFTLEMSAVLTDLLPKKTCVWDCQRTLPNGKKRTIVAGKVFTTRDVTKP